MQRPSVSLFSVLTPRKRKHLDDLHSPIPKRLCVWDNTTEDRRSRGSRTLRQRLHRQLFSREQTPPSTPKRSVKACPKVHSARRVRELRRPEARMKPRSRSKSLTPVNSAKSRKRKIDWLSKGSSRQVIAKNYGLRRPSVSLKPGARPLVKAYRRSRSLSLSSDRSSSIRSKSYDSRSASSSPLQRRKRTRYSSISTPPIRTRKSRRTILLTRSASKPSLCRMRSELQVMSRKKVFVDMEKSREDDQIELEKLQTCTQRLMIQVASATLKVEALNRESAFYRNVLTEIQRVISFAENSVIFSSFPSIQL